MAEVPHLSMPDSRPMGEARPTAALTKQQKLIRYCRLFLGFALMTRWAPRMAISVFKTPVETSTPPKTA